MKYVIFDVARVILDYEPLPFLHSFIKDEETVWGVYHGLMKSETWLDMDRGIIEEEEALTKVCQAHPDIENEIRYAFEHWHDILQPIPATVDFIKSCKQKGCKVYFLSNLHKSTSAFVQQRFAAIWRLFDGGIFSCDTGYIKPEKELFELLVNKYCLNPKECFYVDDHFCIVLAARKLGMKAMHFDKDTEYPRV